MTDTLKKRIHDTLMKVMQMQGGAHIGVGGAMAGGRKRKRKGGVLMNQAMHPDMYGSKRGAGVAGGRKRKRKGGVLMDDRMKPDMYGSKRGGASYMANSVTGGRRRKRRGAGAVGGNKRMGGASPAYRGGANPWITHVKKYAKAHKMTYGEAMKKAKASY
jgi:hypothetical protein